MEISINKIAAGVVGLAMIAGLGFAFTATQAHALTLAELVELFIALEVIPADKADEARTVLSGEEDTTAPTTPGAPAGSVVCTGTFSRNLKVGDTGADVKELQQLLNARGFTVATGGSAGSPGMETMYYGPATAGAVTAMQNAFAGEILAPLGLTTGTGFFGASTRAKANALCSATTPTEPTIPTEPGDDDTDTDTDEDNDLSGGEASLEDFDKLSSPSSVDVEENTEDTEVYGFEFDVKDADAEVNRVDVRFEMTGTGTELDPWDVFETVSLWHDGEMIAEETADDEDAWGNETGNAFSMRFSGLDAVINEGEKAEFIVAVSTGSIDDGKIDTAGEMVWSVWVPAQGVRTIDGAGLDQYIGDANLVADATNEGTFDVEIAGGDTEGNITTASANPSSSIIKVEANSTSEEVATLVMDYESEEGETTINKIVIFATTSDEDLIDVINDVAIEIDGNRFTDWYYAETATGAADTDPDESGYIVFDLEEDNDEYTLDEDEEVSIEVLVKFNERGTNFDEGATVEFDVNSNAVDGWLVDDVNGDDLAADLGGTANGELHQLMTAGIYAEIVSTDADTKDAGTEVNNLGEFIIKFDVTAFEETYYLSATNTAAYDVDILLAGVDTATTSHSIAISSTATKNNNAYRIDEGQTETVTLTITIQPGAAGNYTARLQSVDYGALESAPLDQTAHTVAPVADFETDPIYIQA